MSGKRTCSVESAIVVCMQHGTYLFSTVQFKEGYDMGLSIGLHRSVSESSVRREYKYKICAFALTF